MTKKTAIALGLIVALIAGVAAIGLAVEPSSAIRPITAESACPAAGCASGSCHGYEAIPRPDGVSEMLCPEAGCTSVECHAWDSLTGRYHQASDMSLNVWILMPVALVLGLWVMTCSLSKGGRREEA